MPCTSVLSDCKDPVIVLVDPEHASVASLPLPPNEPVAVVVDRHVSDITFNRDKFYAWDVRGQIRIGWAAEIPHPTQAVIIGQVAYGILEIDEQLRRKRSCWEEENGVYS